MRGAGGLNKEWLDRDRTVVERVGRLVGGPIQLERLRAVVGSNWEETDLGFGAKRIRAAAHGGYHGAWITIAVFSNQVYCGNMVAAPGAAIPTEAYQRIRTMWANLAVVSDVYIAQTRWEDTNLMRTVDANRWSTLGRPPAGHVAAHARKDVIQLSSPLAALVCGSMRSYGAQPPPGCQEAQRLADAGDAGPLLTVLRSGSPEGRVYACHHLQNFSVAGDVLQTISRVRTLPLPIAYASGATLMRGTATDALRALAS
jgi:hypothetical protein